MIGIYKLNFEGLDWVYVGQSLSIERRLSQHLLSLKNVNSNYKLQEAYEMCGEPTLTILEECTSDDLNLREVYWIKEFDSINNGLNLTSGGDSSGQGYEHAKSKFTREQLIEALELLTHPEYTMERISEITGVSKNQVHSISKKRSHVWLQYEFPEMYEKISKILRNMHGFEEDLEVTVISPEGLEYIITSPNQLTKKLNESEAFNAGISELLNGRRSHYKKWILKGNELTKYYFLSPTEEVYVVLNRGLKALAERFQLHRTSLALMVKGQQKQHHGWTLISKDEVNNYKLGD